MVRGDENNTFNIAEALERRHGIPVAIERPQQETEKTVQKSQEETKLLPAPRQRGYRNRKYREAWKTLYEKLKVPAGDAKILSYVADLMRPAYRRFSGVSIPSGIRPVGNGAQEKSRLIEYLKMTEADQNYIATVEKQLPDRIDMNDRHVREKLGVTEKLLIDAENSIKDCVLWGLYMPSPHMIAAALPDKTAKTFLTALEDLEASGEKLPVCLARPEGRWDLRFPHFQGFADTSNLLKRIYNASISPEKIRDVETSGESIKDYLNGCKYIDAVGRYFSKLDGLGEGCSLSSYTNKAKNFYSFNWVGWRDRVAMNFRTVRA